MMKYLLLLIIVSLVATLEAKADGDKFESAHSLLLDGQITQGKIHTRSTNTQSQLQEIEAQLMYTIGQLNEEEGGAPDMAKTKISINQVTPLSNGRLEVSYTAHLKISWPKEISYPVEYTFYLPKEGNTYFLSQFLDEFGPEGDSHYRCIEWFAHDVGLGNLWYYYRPKKDQCPLNRNDENSMVFQVKILLQKSEENTENKFPEYHKIWEDNTLVATLVFGMNEPDQFSDYDVGVLAFGRSIQMLLNEFGEGNGRLTWSNITGLDYRYRPRDDQRIVHLKFNKDGKEIDVMLILVNEIRRVASGSIIEQTYHERTRISDFVSYNGHSGLGANIRKLTKMGDFVKNQYQIFMINGCDTFAYIDHSLENAHQLVNPEFAPSKFFDIITNSMPSYFDFNAQANLNVLSTLFEQKKNYRELLSLFDQRQRATVVGEEDNNWPAPFLN